MMAMLPVAVPLVAGPLAYLAAAALPAAPDRRRGAAAWWVALAALIAVAASLAGVARLLAAGGEPAFGFGGLALRFDGLALLQAVVAVTLAIAGVVGSRPAIADEGKYYAVLLLMVGAMIGVGAATDLFNLWIWVEAMAAGAYVLVASHRDRPASLEAAVKYLTQGVVGSTLVLVGIAIVLAHTGTLDLAALARDGAAPAAAGAFLMVGFGVKAALAPLHMWLPDAHAEAPSGISAMLSGIVIEVGVIAMLRALAGVSAPSISWGVLLLAFAALNLLVGNLLALGQTQVKRLLAFSSVSHVGYMLLGFGVAVHAGAAAAAEGGALHVVTHALMKGLAFLSTGALIHALPLIAQSDRGLRIDDLAGVAGRYPIVAAALSVAVLGLGGLPPLAGFMSKWQILVAGFMAGDPAVAAVVVFAALNTVLSLAYYVPIVNALYRRAPSRAVAGGRTVPVLMLVPLVALGLAVFVIGVRPGVVRWLVEPAGAALLRAVGGAAP